MAVGFAMTGMISYGRGSWYEKASLLFFVRCCGGGGFRQKSPGSFAGSVGGADRERLD